MKRFSEDEIVEFLTSNCPGDPTQIQVIYATDDEARAAWQGWIEHMEAGGYQIGVEVGT